MDVLAWRNSPIRIPLFDWLASMHLIAIPSEMSSSLPSNLSKIRLFQRLSAETLMQSLIVVWIEVPPRLIHRERAVLLFSLSFASAALLTFGESYNP